MSQEAPAAQAPKKHLLTGSGKLGMRVNTPDGDGTIDKIYNADNARVKLDRKSSAGKDIFYVGDLSSMSEYVGDGGGA